MRTVALLCALSALTFPALGGATARDGGVLSVAGGKGVVVVQLKGSLLGRLEHGSLTVTDLTPGDRFAPIVTGRRLRQVRLARSTVLYKGEQLRFRVVGGSFRVAIRGKGIDVSAVGRGFVTLDGDRAEPGDDAGTYSIDGVDCSVEPDACAPLPDDPVRILIGGPPLAPQPNVDPLR